MRRREKRSPTVPTPPPKRALRPDEVSRVRMLRRQVSEGKESLGESMLQYEATKERLVAHVDELSKRAVAIVNESCEAQGMDPATTSFSWDDMTFTPTERKATP